MAEGFFPSLERTILTTGDHLWSSIGRLTSSPQKDVNVMRFTKEFVEDFLSVDDINLLRSR